MYGHAPGVGFLGAGGAQGVKKYLNMVMLHINRMGWQAEQNASKIFTLGSSWWPLGEVKGQISLNFDYHVHFKDFLYQTLCVFSQMKDT